MNGSMASAKADARPVLTGSLFVLIAALGFSGKAILIKLAYAAGAVDAISLLALRMAMSLPFFLIASVWIAKADRQPAMTRWDWLITLALGTVGYYFASFLDFAGLLYISAGLERLVLFLYPTLVVLFSGLIYRQRLRVPQIMALFLSYLGIGFVVFEDIGTRPGELWVGTGLVFASAVAFACYMMGSGEMIRRIGSFRFTCYSMIVACLATGIHFGLQPGSRMLGLPARIYGLSLLMALVSTVLPAFFMNAGIRRLGSGTASIISCTGPVATLALAYILLGETLSPVQMLGAGLVLGGVYLITWFSFHRDV